MPENWLLDVQLAHGEFRTDQVAIWLSELELGLEFTDVVQAHAEFFQAIKRKDALKKLLKADDTAGQIRLKMLAVCTGSEPRMDAVVENLLQELADGRDEKIKLVGRCSLDGFLWEQMTRCYGYKSDEPGIRDFAMKAVNASTLIGLGFLERFSKKRFSASMPAPLVIANTTTSSSDSRAALIARGSLVVTTLNPRVTHMS